MTAAAFVSESATRYALVCAGPSVNETISRMDRSFSYARGGVLAAEDCGESI